MREYVQLLRGLWAGETVKHEGEVYKLDSVKLSFKPIRAEIPIYLAARGPKMFELAGETADGVLINEGFAAPKYFEWAKTSLAKGVEKAGRVLSDVDVAAYVFMSVADEHEAAKERVKPGVVSMLAQGVLTPQLERLGSSIDDVAPVIKACKQGDMRAACKLVPDRLLQNASIYGTPAECERQMRNLREVGLNIPIILPVGDWNTIIPLAKEW
jgi:5,10-methylenetetrahydromethanopterin reductase